MQLFGDVKNPKLRQAGKLFSEHIQEIVQGTEGWMSFLTCAGRMYKYSFADQLLIHAQRPDATACAAIDFWNERMQRRVKRGAKGIMLIDRANPTSTKLRYVFDIGDTYQLHTGKPTPYVWQLREAHLKPVKQMLGKLYGIDDPDTKTQLTTIVKKITIAYNGDPLLKELIAESAVYSILSRCGLDTGEMPESFASMAEIPALKEPEQISELGIAVGEVAEGILLNIEGTVKNVDHWLQRRNERGEKDGDRVRAAGGLSDSGDRTGRSGERGEAAQEVRPDAPAALAAEREGALHDIGDQGRAGSASAGDGRGGAGTGKPIHRADAPEGTGTGQEQRPDGLGRIHGEFEGARGGDRDEGAHLRLETEAATNPGEAEPPVSPDSPPNQPELLSPFAPQPSSEVKQSTRPQANPQPPPTDNPYVVGDEVYLDDGRSYRIERIEPEHVTLKALELVNNGLVIAFTDVRTEDFEEQLRGNLFNQEILSRVNRAATVGTAEPQTASPVNAPAPSAIGAQKEPEAPLLRDLGDILSEMKEKRRADNERAIASGNVSVEDARLNEAISRLERQIAIERERAEKAGKEPTAERSPTQNRPPQPLTDDEIFHFHSGDRIKVATLLEGATDRKDAANALKDHFGTSGNTTDLPDGSRGMVDYRINRTHQRSAG